jgi:hypothetical protein
MHMCTTCVNTSNRNSRKKHAAMTPGLRRLYVPYRVAVEAGPGGEPLAVDGVAVEAVREEWVAEDRWWTPHPLGRHYFELVLADGCNLVVFRSIVSRRWYRQRG